MSKHESTPRRRLLGAVAALVLVASLAPAVHAGPYIPVDVAPPIAPPGASWSSGGDFATDEFGDPWDFSNAEDVDTTTGVGVYQPRGQATLGNGALTVPSRPGTIVRLLMSWTQASADGALKSLPWGRDGWKHPIDPGRYTRVSFRVYSSTTIEGGIRWTNADGAVGVMNVTVAAGWNTYVKDLTNYANYPHAGSQGVCPANLAPGQCNPWQGAVVNLEFLHGSGPNADLSFDWFRLTRPDAPTDPPADARSTPPTPLVISPSEVGGADYATTQRANPWDLTGPDDIVDMNQLANVSYSSGDLTATATSNDPMVELALNGPIDPDRFHRVTVDVCYDGTFGLDDAPGQGMVGRLAWMSPFTAGQWTVTQDFIVFPGCESITLDLATSPALAVNDEDAPHLTGWRGQPITRFRFDFEEDLGQRSVRLSNVRLADDAAFSDAYGITFDDAAGQGGTADIFVSTQRGSFDGTQIANDVQVGSGPTTFDWNGRDINGNLLPDGSYWVLVRIQRNGLVGSAHASGPVRLERPVPSTPGYFVPLTPSRVLDTRTGIGGNVVPLGPGWTTQVQIAGSGGVPPTGATGVVLNVTAVDPAGGGYVTAWPSGEARPATSNLNFTPATTVPNLVTVKLGANGRVNLYNESGNTHLLADVVGYLTPNQPSSGGRYNAVNPGRVLDTRPENGGAGALAPNSSMSLHVTGVAGVPPSGVSAVALNVTVAQATAPGGYLTVWPTGEARPTASTHNFAPGVAPVANLVLAKVGAGGNIDIYNFSGSTHVLADVIGYFSSSSSGGGGGRLVPISPSRVLDTRNGTGGVPVAPVSGGRVVSAPVAGTPGVPADATAAVVNVTSADSVDLSVGPYVTGWPSGANRPLASTLNPRPGAAIPNAAYLKLGNGRIDLVLDAGSSNLVVDVFAYVI